MKSTVPPANVVIATLYLLIIIGIGYVTKLAFKTTKHTTSNKKSVKYGKNDIKKGLTNPTIQAHLPLWTLLFRSFANKYTLIGAARNSNKSYLLKEIFIASIIFVCATATNRIIVWPVGLAVGFLVVFFVAMTVFNLPFIWQNSAKVDQQKNNRINESPQPQLQIQPQILPEHRSSSTQLQQQAHSQKMPSPQQQQILYSFKYICSLAVLCFASLVLFTQTMMTIFNSVSNLGALNIGSAAIVLLIDQALIRPAILGFFMLAVRIRLWRLGNQRGAVVQNNQVQLKNRVYLDLFENEIFANLCQEELLAEMNLIFEQYGANSNYSMGASPTRKKTFSPSKVPKAHIDSETLMNLDLTKQIKPEINSEEEVKEVEEENIEKSPIKEIDLGCVRESIYLTTAQKDMFWQQIENDQMKNNKPEPAESTMKIKINPNQYFSVQRLPKDELNHEEHIEDDGLVLVEAGMNLVKEKDLKYKPSTIDIDFSPTKKRKKVGGYHPKRRQLIITGSSPYLEYLPDMMKKQKNKKNMTPSSQFQPGMLSRKVL